MLLSKGPAMVSRVARVVRVDKTIVDSTNEVASGEMHFIMETMLYRALRNVVESCESYEWTT